MAPPHPHMSYGAIITSASAGSSGDPVRGSRDHGRGGERRWLIAAAVGALALVGWTATQIAGPRMSTEDVVRRTTQSHDASPQSDRDPHAHFSRRKSPSFPLISQHSEWLALPCPREAQPLARLGPTAPARLASPRQLLSLQTPPTASIPSHTATRHTTPHRSLHRGHFAGRTLP